MPILAFGYHDQASPRHHSVCSALGGQVVECHTDAPGFFGKCKALWISYRDLAYQTHTVLVPFPGHYLMPLAWLLTRRPKKRLIFDAFLSLYDTAVDDRHSLSKWDPRAWMLFLVDWVSCHLADEVIVDTEAHRTWFIQTFHLRPSRVRVIYLEARKDLFFPKERPVRESGSAVEIVFYGTYIPLQGVEYILDAVKLLENKLKVHVTLIGRGQMYAAMRAKAESLHLQSVTFLPKAPLTRLPDLLRIADLCLGIFGVSGKATRVIPHKVYDAVACGVPVLTANTPAIRERFMGNPLVLLCEAGNPKAIADAILAYFSHAAPDAIRSV